jgi:hypothetical protein
LFQLMQWFHAPRPECTSTADAAKRAACG